MGSGGILLLLIAAFLLVSFVTGRLDWLQRLNSDFGAAVAPAGAASSSAPYGQTGARPSSTAA